MKRYLAVFLCLCLIGLGGFTVSAKAELGTGVLWVGRVDIVGSGGTVSDGNGGTATLSYDSDGNPVLTLNNYKYTGLGHQRFGKNCALCYAGADTLTIILKGDNVLECTGTEAYDSGICSDKDGTDLIIKGKGSLRAKGNNYGIISYGKLIIDEADITAISTGKRNSDLNCGISAEKGIEIKGGKVTAQSAEGRVNYAIYNRKGDIIISGGTVTAVASRANGGSTTAGNSTGIAAGFGTIKIKDGDVTATGGQATADSGSSYGIYAQRGAEISGGKTVATAGEAPYRSYGFYGQSITITEGDVTLAGYSGAVDNSVKNSIPGTGWTDYDGTEGRTDIEKAPSGQDLSGYRKLRFLGLADAPAFSPAAGTYGKPQTVTITSPTSGAAIYYTTDGSVPTAAGTKYTGPVSVTKSTVIRAIAVKKGLSDSPVASAEYKLAYQLVYDANGGTGTMDPMLVDDQMEFEFPECRFGAPEHKTFDHWQMTGVDGQFRLGQLVKVTSSCLSGDVITVTAYWKDAPAATVTTAPEAKDLTYTGDPQPLVTAGQAQGGAMAYVPGTDSTTAPASGWSADIPTGTDAGTYYVWYKAAGDDTHSDSEPKCVPVIIKKATPDAPPPPTAEKVTTTGVTLKKTAGYQYCMEGTAWQNSNVFDGLTKNTKYTFYQRIAGDDNHEPSPSSEGTDITTEDISYEAVNAEGTEQTSGAIAELVVQIKRSENDDLTFGSYTGAEMDGKAIPEEQTARAKGSLILTVKKAYMETLAAGSHTLTVNFTDGSVEIPVKINAAPPTPTPKPVPKTGDTSDLLLWGGLVILGIIGMAAVMKRFSPRKKKK